MTAPPRHAPLLLALLGLVAACSHAGTEGLAAVGREGTPAAAVARPAITFTGIAPAPNAQQRQLIGNLDLSAARFFEAYMSQDVAQRRSAEMYLAGVLDAGEGQAWCGYRVASPSAIQEVLHLGLQKQSAESMRRRAAVVIGEVMKARLPCKATP